MLSRATEGRHLHHHRAAAVLPPPQVARDNIFSVSQALLLPLFSFAFNPYHHIIRERQCRLSHVACHTRVADCRMFALCLNTSHNYITVLIYVHPHMYLFLSNKIPFIDLFLSSVISL